VIRRELRLLFHVLDDCTGVTDTSMCNELREPLLTANSFRQLLKTRLFAEY